MARVHTRRSLYLQGNARVFHGLGFLNGYSEGEDTGQGRGKGVEEPRPRTLAAVGKRRVKAGALTSLLFLNRSRQIRECLSTC
jgi:hypothetical protein